MHTEVGDITLISPLRTLMRTETFEPLHSAHKASILSNYVALLPKGFIVGNVTPSWNPLTLYSPKPTCLRAEMHLFIVRPELWGRRLVELDHGEDTLPNHPSPYLQQHEAPVFPRHPLCARIARQESLDSIWYARLTTTHRSVWSIKWLSHHVGNAGII